jgi:hypothetical protein
MHRNRIIVSLTLAFACVTIAGSGVIGQQLPRRIPPALRRPPSLDTLLNRPPLTTTLNDAATDVALLDGFNPESGSPLFELPLGFNEGVTIVPGLWEATVRSYCLEPGTYGPTRGDGYLWAPLKGSKAEIISAILNNSARHPEIPQEDVQVLLWGILARTNVGDLNDGARKAAETLLSSAQLASIDGSAVDLVASDALSRLTQGLDDVVRRALEAENRLREVFANPGDAAYEELERIAVLEGAREARGRVVPEGRWSWHPQGYFIRFLPNHYTNMRIQIYSPEAFTLRRACRPHLAAA